MQNHPILRHLYMVTAVTGGVLFLILMFYLGRPRPEWETTTHEQYGFSFEYPTEWRVHKYGEGISYHGDEYLSLEFSWE